MKILLPVVLVLLLLPIGNPAVTEYEIAIANLPAEMLGEGCTGGWLTKHPLLK